MALHSQLLRIYVARHGETDWNRERRLQGATDVPLNGAGLAQAQALGEMFSGVPLDRIFCSDLQRSRGTAKALQGRALITALPELNEQALGAFEGKSLDDPAVRTEWQRRTGDAHDMLDGGESDEQHYRRIVGAVAEVRRQYPAGTVLIVGHGGTNAKIVRALFGLSQTQTQHLRFANGEVVLIEIVQGRPPSLWRHLPREYLESTTVLR